MPYEQLNEFIAALYTICTPEAINMRRPPFTRH